MISHRVRVAKKGYRMLYSTLGFLGPTYIPGGATMKARVAAIQTKTFLEADEQKKNIEMAWQYAAEAAKQGANFLCFPETYPGPWKAPLSYSPVAPLEEMARKYGVYI